MRCDYGNGWEGLSWFGLFNTDSSPWIYHQMLGWLYPFGTSTESMWFWDPQWNCRVVGGGPAVRFPMDIQSKREGWLYYDTKDSCRWTMVF